MNTHGGKRTGAGRPATGAKPIRAFRLSDSEYETVKSFIKNIRREKKMTYEIALYEHNGDCGTEVKALKTANNSYEANLELQALPASVLENSRQYIDLSEVNENNEVINSWSYIHNGRNWQEISDTEKLLEVLGLKD